MTTVEIYNARQNEVVIVDKIEKSNAEWGKMLTKLRALASFIKSANRVVSSVCVVTPTFSAAPPSSIRGRAGRVIMNQSRRLTLLSSLT